MSTYAEIVSILQNWNEDDSTEFSNVIPDIISRAEDRIFRIVPALIDHRTLETGNLVSGNELVTTSATDIRGIRYIYLTVNTVKTFLEQRTDEYLEDYWISGNRGLPKYYALHTATTSGTTFLLAPTPDTTYAYTLKYTRLPTRLSSSNTTTYVSNNHPDVLVKSALYESAIFLNREVPIRNELKVDFEGEASKLVAEVQTNYQEIQ
jgi:hypothetical protein|tara:strand:- start:63 stop:683 length:621 start_codon:yes stop_codon:yes gene_type:complete